MEIEFTSRRENALLGREEIEFVVTHAGEATPERATVRDNIAARVDANSGLVVVDHMDTEFGVTRTEGYAKVYEGVEALRDVESDYVLERNGLHTGDDSEADEAGDESEAADEGDDAETDDEAEEAEAEAEDEAEAEA